MASKKNPRKDKGVQRKDLYFTSELDKIRIVPGLNARKNLGDLTELKKSIETMGLINPLVVRRNVDSEETALWDLIGGERRLTAVKELRAEGHEIRVPLREVTCTDEDAHLLMALDNMERRDFDPVEEAEIVIRFERMGWSDKDIADRLGRTLPWVAERRALYTAAPEVKEEIREGLAADVGADIARAGGEEKQRQILADAKAEAQKEASKKGRGTNWRRNMRRTVGKGTGRKMSPGKRQLRTVQTEVADAIKNKVINGQSKKVLIALDFALGEIDIDQFRDAIGYVLEEDTSS